MCKKQVYAQFSAVFFAIFGLVMVQLAATFEEKASHEMAYLT